MQSDKSRKELTAAVAAVLAGVATRREREVVEQWRSRSESNRQLWERLSGGDDTAKKLSDIELTDVDGGWRRLERRIDRRRFLRRAAVASACAAAVVGAVSILHFGDMRGGPQIAVAVQEQQVSTTGAQLILADGSVVAIDQQGDMEIEEKGATIYKDSSHIDYSRNVAMESAAQETAPVFNELRMPNGMSYTMTLSDGTRVFLNAESRLRFPVNFSGERREVEFEGEAYFSVARNEACPFVIRANGLEVTVLGTEFNLRAYGNEPEVVTTLVSGRVRLADGDNVCDITPGEQAVYDPLTGAISTQQVDVDFYTAWCRSEILFKDARLDEIMKDLARWYPIEYEFLDERAAAVEFGGSFRRSGSIDPILDMIGRTELLNVVRAGDKIYFSSKRKP